MLTKDGLVDSHWLLVGGNSDDCFFNIVLREHSLLLIFGPLDEKYLSPGKYPRNRKIFADVILES